MKKCFKCLNEKPLSDFYKHAKMGDGHLNKCKECTRTDTLKNRLDKIDYYRAYDKSRASRPNRVLARKLYSKTPEGKAAVIRAHKNWEKTHPDRRKAQHIVNNAIRDKKLFKQPCFVCGHEKVEAHHPVYSLPLDVVWLCNSHHRQTHKEANEYRMAA